jgi:hypothetical protein
MYFVKLNATNSAIKFSLVQSKQVLIKDDPQPQAAHMRFLIFIELHRTPFHWQALTLW